MALTFNSVAFREPNAIPTSKPLVVEFTSSYRGLNGFLNVESVSFAQFLVEKELIFTILTAAELTTLTNLNGELVSVVYDTYTDSAFSGTYLLTFDNYEESYAGRKTGIKIKLTPQI